MTFRPNLLPSAIADLSEIYLWYRSEDASVAERFRRAFEAQFDLILAQPRLYAKRPDGLRRVIVHGFPYHIGYLVDNDLVVVVGVIHAARHPALWISRVTKSGDE